MKKAPIPPITAIVFDLGNVLVDWHPRHAYAPLFQDRPEELEYFLSHVCTLEWHSRHDAGISFARNIRERQQQFPQYKAEIAAYDSLWDQMFAGEIEESVQILQQLKQADYPLYALSNFPAEKFAAFRKEYSFMEVFEDCIISGQEEVIKPDPRIYEILLKRSGKKPHEMLFIDDRLENVEAAVAMGLHGLHFTDATQLARDLKIFNLLP